MNKLIMFCIAMSISFSAVADKRAKQVNESTMEIKCYVELVGGGETIHFAEVISINNNYDINDVKKLKIDTPGSKQKRDIYRINECVLADQEFTESKANKLESEMVW